MDGIVLVGFVKVIGISLVPVVVFSAALHAGAAVERCTRAARRLHLARPPDPAPLGPPLEKVAADLRRLHPLARMPAPGVPMARQLGIVAAYDTNLLEAARALSVPTTLDELPTHALDREAERLRLEHELTQAGLSWQLRRS